MKKVLLVVSLFALAACSSTPEVTQESVEPTVTDAGAAPMATTATEPPAAAAPATPPPAQTPDPVPTGGDFPPIEGTERMVANCTNGGDTRMVSAIDRNGGGCGVVYTKSGEKRTVAMANNDMGYCDKVFENIKGNLSGAGFDCGDGGGGTAAAAEPAAQPEAAKEEMKAKGEEMKAEGQ